MDSNSNLIFELEGLGMYQGEFKEKSGDRFKRNTWLFVIGNKGWSQGGKQDGGLDILGFGNVFGEDSKEGIDFRI